MGITIVPLKELIAEITNGTNIHICIHDISGFTAGDIFRIDMKNKIHSAKICDASKTTDKGMKLCLTCKMLANNKAIQSKQMFIGICPSGITEVVQPIVINSNVIGIIYVGNLVSDKNNTVRKIKNTCRLTNADENQLISALEASQYCCDIERFKNIAGLIYSYISLIYNKCNIITDSETHWAVSAVRDYIMVYYNKDISISKFAKLYYINEKYIGRLFKKQMNMSFNQYLNHIRIENACNLLKQNSSKIIDIAYDVGYNNVTYFNRIFKENKGMTPIEYINRFS